MRSLALGHPFDARASSALRPQERRLDHVPLRDKVWELLWADCIQTTGELKRELTAHPRSRRQARKPHTGQAKRATLGITEDITIRARPAEVEVRAVPGHWEGNLLLGSTGNAA